MKNIFVLAPTAFILLLTSNAQAATTADVILEGTIITSTCEVTANHGAAALNLGSFDKALFATAKSQVGQEPLVVKLENCTNDEIGALQVTGIVSSIDDTIFVSSTDKSAGFMLKQSDGVTQVANHSSVPVTADASGTLEYSFQAGMGVFDTGTVVAGDYSAPIKVSFISN